VYVVSCRKSPFNIFILFQSRLLKFICKWLTLNRDTYKAKQCRTWSVKVPCRPVLSRHLTDCETAPINPRGNTKPLYINGVQRYFCSLPPSPLPTRTESRLFGLFATQIFHVDTFDINSIRQGLVPIHGSAVFIRVTTSACTLLGLFSALPPCDGQLFAPRVSRVPESLCTNCARLVVLPLSSGTFCLDRPRFRMSNANFPLQRHFTGVQVRLLLIISSQVKERRTTYVHCLFFSFAARIFGAKNFYFP